MAGETIKTDAICLGIHPWSKTSHVTSWLTPSGRVATVVKGAVRPKSAFLGQYDLNYTCEILYYARAKGDLHPLRECTPKDSRDFLRGDYRQLVLAEHFRHIAAELAPAGPDAAEWFDLLASALDSLRNAKTTDLLSSMLEFEKKALGISGVWPEIPYKGGDISFPNERRIPIPETTAACLDNIRSTSDVKILLDAARVISVLYTLSLELTSDSRRSVLQLICKPNQG